MSNQEQLQKTQSMIDSGDKWKEVLAALTQDNFNQGEIRLYAQQKLSLQVVQLFMEKNQNKNPERPSPQLSGQQQGLIQVFAECLPQINMLFSTYKSPITRRQSKNVVLNLIHIIAQYLHVSGNKQALDNLLSLQIEQIQCNCNQQQYVQLLKESLISESGKQKTGENSENDGRLKYPLIQKVKQRMRDMDDYFVKRAGSLDQPVIHQQLTNDLLFFTNVFAEEGMVELMELQYNDIGPLLKIGQAPILFSSQKDNMNPQIDSSDKKEDLPSQQSGLHVLVHHHQQSEGLLLKIVPWFTLQFFQKVEVAEPAYPLSQEKIKQYIESLQQLTQILKMSGTKILRILTSDQNSAAIVNKLWAMMDQIEDELSKPHHQDKHLLDQHCLQFLQIYLNKVRFWTAQSIDESLDHPSDMKITDDTYVQIINQIKQANLNSDIFSLLRDHPQRAVYTILEDILHQHFADEYALAGEEEGELEGEDMDQDDVVMAGEDGEVEMQEDVMAGEEGEFDMEEMEGERDEQSP